MTLFTDSELFRKRRTFLVAAATLAMGLSSGLVVPAARGAADFRACTAGPGNAYPADVYVPMDSWVYPALDRLHGLGFADTAFLGLRPWTKRSIQRIIDDTSNADGIQDNAQAFEILASMKREFGVEGDDPSALSYACEGVYTRLQGISGQTLRDSFHLGQSIKNDYGRPYQPGFNTVTGLGGSAQFGRFSLYARGEYQHSPSATGYSPALVSLLANVDTVPLATNPVQATIPAGPIKSVNAFRIVEANLSYRLLNHQFSIGKSDHWVSPTIGGAFLYSNNAENIYAFQIDRTEPLFIPLLSRLTGPFRYDFFVGSLKGHTYPNSPWLHTEKINFKPTQNLEIGFSRSTIWGGKGHTPITIHTFLKSFFSFQNVSAAEKNSRGDPGARFGSFDFSWRLPFLSHRVTLYSDSLVHDDVSPIDAPRHAGVRPGVYLSAFPGVAKLDLRFEGVDTDPATSRSSGGGYLYAENVQLQGYTNKGLIMGDAIGRQGKGGDAWLTYHLSPMEMVQASFRHTKVARDFIPSGTTQNSFDVHVVKRLNKDLELSAEVQREWWKAPIYQPGQQSNTVFTFQFTVYPERRPAR